MRATKKTSKVPIETESWRAIKSPAKPGTLKHHDVQEAVRKLANQRLGENGQIVAEIEKGVPLRSFELGDTVQVTVRFRESETKERTQAFEGVVVARKHGSVRDTITVRKTSFGVGVEKTFPLVDTVVDRIDVIKTGRIRRAKLYYLRGLRRRALKLRERPEENLSNSSKAESAKGRVGTD